MKWYESKTAEDGSWVSEWWTQRNHRGVCFSIRQSSLSKKYRLRICGHSAGDFDTLAEAMNAAEAFDNGV